MVDLFGIQKETEPAALSGDGERLPSKGGGPLPAADAASGSRTRPKLWGALLVMDSILLIVFGGAVAAKLYQHLYSPVNNMAPAARHRPGKPPLTTGAPPSAPTPQPTPAAKAAEPPPAAPPQPPTSTAGPKAAKPTLLAEPMKGRGTPKPQAAGKTAATQPPAPSGSGERQTSRESAAPAASIPAEKRHSVPVEFKFKEAPHARSVQLAGAFIVRGGRREMVQQDAGVWTLTLYLLPGAEYRYWFLVNGKKTLDPENGQVQRGASVLVLP